jgi:hypothetical protein
MKFKIWVRMQRAKVITFLALLCFCASSIPLPLANFDFRDKDLKQPFPCQNSPCGCKTAEQCWSNCCCLTPKQRLAWAERNGVTPPSYAALPAKNPGDSSTIKSCCVKQLTPDNAIHLSGQTLSGCDPQSSNVSPQTTVKRLTNKVSCCQPKEYTQVSEATNNKKDKQSVLLMFALKCQGKSSAFTLLPWTILLSTPDVGLSQPVSTSVPLAATTEPVNVFQKPDTPVPRPFFF